MLVGDVVNTTGEAFVQLLYVEGVMCGYSQRRTSENISGSLDGLFSKLQLIFF